MKKYVVVFDGTSYYVLPKSDLKEVGGKWIDLTYNGYTFPGCDEVYIFDSFEDINEAFEIMFDCND